MSSKTKSTATMEEATPALVPKLRFPEFRGAFTWREGRIADIAVSESSSRALNKLSLRSEGYPVYGADSCVGFIDSFDQADDYIAIVKDGSGVGRLALKRGKSSVLGTLAYIKCKPGSETKLSWLYYCLNSLDLRQFVKGSGIPHIYFSDYATHEVLIPPLPEQQKIAECLSSVDELMAAQARIVDALKTHKKGLMQQLFPREGETQPRLRFPEFQNAGEWASEPLGDLGEIVTGKTPSTKEADLWGGDLLFITPTDISDDDKYQHTTARTVVETKSTKILPAGSVVYTCIASIGKMALTVLPSITNQQINAVVPNEKVLGEFIYYALANLTPWIKTIPATNTLPIINKTDFSKIAILLPEDKAEQQRIADCLTSLDDLIAAQTQKHEALKTHKKGLMQQLFPSPEDSQ